MIKIFVGVFLLLHAIVHLLYFGQSSRLFALQPGLTWPDASWAFSRLMGDINTRTLASIFCILAAVGLIIGSAGIFFSQSWWRIAVVVSAAFSIFLYLFLWNGQLKLLDAQGGIGILIDAAILAATLYFRWPEFGF